MEEYKLWLKAVPKEYRQKLARPLGLRLETLIASELLEQWNLYEIRITTRNGRFLLRRGGESVAER